MILRVRIGFNSRKVLGAERMPFAALPRHTRRENMRLVSGGSLGVISALPPPKMSGAAAIRYFRIQTGPDWL